MITEPVIAVPDSTNQVTFDVRLTADGENPGTSAQYLLDSYRRALVDHGQPKGVTSSPDPAIRKRQSDAAWAFGHLSRALGLPLDQIDACELVRHRDQFDLMLQSGSLTGASRRVCKTHLSTVVEWAILSEAIPLDPGTILGLGYPDLETIQQAVPEQIPLQGYRMLVRFLCSRNISAQSLKANDVSVFLSQLQQDTRYWRRIYTDLLRGWPYMVQAELMPAITLPSAPSKRPPKMALPWDLVPESLKNEIETVLSRFRGDAAQPPRLDRRGKPKKRVHERTVQKRREEILKHLGFVRNVLNVSLESLTLVQLMTFDTVMARARHTNGDSVLAWNGQECLPMGRYQKDIFEECQTILRCLDGAESEIERIGDFMRLNRLHFEARREPRRRIPPLDTAFQVAYTLGVRSLVAETKGKVLEASLLRRDALILVLTGCYGLRTSVPAGCDHLKHVSMDVDGAPCVLTPKEITKRQIVDGLYEVPPEARGLFRAYALTDRARILNSSQTDAFLVSVTGKPLSSHAIYEIITDRTREVLGQEICPRALRKAWARGWDKYSGHDFLTGATVMDTSVEQFQKTYAAGRDEELMARFDETTVNEKERSQ